MVGKVKLSLIPDWKQAWRYASMRINAAGLFLMGAAEVLSQSWVSVPPSLQAKLPHAPTVAMALFGLGLIGRILKKEPKDG